MSADRDEPVTGLLLGQYWNWLFYERRILCSELAAGDQEKRAWLESLHGGDPAALMGGGPHGEAALLSMRNWPVDPTDKPHAAWPEFHFPHPGSLEDVPKPSTRAALIFRAIDFDWRPR